MNQIWSVRFRVNRDESDCFVLKRYGLRELKEVIKELKVDVKTNGVGPVSTWILEHMFRTFDKEYKNQGYTLLSVAITNKRKSNGTTP
jgi:hypothetical protein